MSGGCGTGSVIVRFARTLTTILFNRVPHQYPHGQPGDDQWTGDRRTNSAIRGARPESKPGKPRRCDGTQRSDGRFRSLRRLVTLL